MESVSSDAEYIDDASHFDEDSFIDGIDAGRGRKETEFRDADVDVDAHSDGSSVDEKHAELGVGPVREASGSGALDYVSAHQDYHDSYRVKNALSLKELWPHIRLLLEGYVLLWYLHHNPGEWALPDFDDDALQSADTVVEVWALDFAAGTYRILEPGTHKVMENVLFA